MMTRYLTKGGIAKLVGVGSLTPFAWEKKGWIAPIARTESGIALYDPKMVKRFLTQRKRRLNGGRPARSR